MTLRFNKFKTLTSKSALLGRETEVPTATHHAVFSSPLKREPSTNDKTLVFGMGCFWGAEKIFWQIEGVYNTAVGYAGGFTPNPTYEEICSGRTGHAEVVKVDYDPTIVRTSQILKFFWEGHDPTQGMRQGNDIGSQYRSAVYWTSSEQESIVSSTRQTYAQALDLADHYSKITTEIAQLNKFYFAEDYHQQYLIKNPNGYCGIGGTGVACPLEIHEDA